MSHYLGLAIRNHGIPYVYLAVGCDEPEGAWCRMTFPKGCEAVGDCDHPAVDAGYCLAVKSLSEDGVADSYGGPDADLRPGVIEVSWNRGTWMWRYAEEQQA